MRTVDEAGQVQPVLIRELRAARLRRLEQVLDLRACVTRRTAQRMVSRERCAGAGTVGAVRACGRSRSGSLSSTTSLSSSG